MRLYKMIDEEYIIAIGSGDGGIEIGQNDYLRIKSLIENRPTAPEGYRYRLTVAEEWKLVENRKEHPEEEEPV